MRTVFARARWLLLSLALVMGAAFRSSGFDDKDQAKAKAKEKDNPSAPLEVYEWSIWVGNPAQTTLNTTRNYKNAMPGPVGTNRPKFEGKELEGKFPIAPVSVVQFFGDPSKDVDVNLRAKKGLFLSHWPTSTERAGRLQWFKSDFSANPPANIPQTYLPNDHWFQKLRQNTSALFLKHESHYERFIAYDAEVAIPIPVKIRGGPDEYTLQNLTNRRLLDVAVIAPTDNGFRVGWLDELPTATPEKADESDGKKEEPAAKKKDGAAAKKKDGAATKKEEASKKTDAQKAEAVFQEAETKKKDEEEEPTPLPAEGDANVRARVEPGAQPADRGERSKGAPSSVPRPDRGSGPPAV